MAVGWGAAADGWGYLAIPGQAGWGQQGRWEQQGMGQQAVDIRSWAAAGGQFVTVANRLLKALSKACGFPMGTETKLQPH